jgi:hypothetical protein
MKQIPLGPYDDRAWLALSTLLQADLAFDRGDLYGAMARYSQAIPMIAMAEGMPASLFEVRINELIKRLKSLDKIQVALEWGRTLKGTFLDAQVDKSFPLIIERLQMLLDDLVQTPSSM